MKGVQYNFWFSFAAESTLLIGNLYTFRRRNSDGLISSPSVIVSALIWNECIICFWGGSLPIGDWCTGKQSGSHKIMVDNTWYVELNIGQLIWIYSHLTLCNNTTMRICCLALNRPMIFSTDRSKAVVPVLILLFVALWFILRGDLLYFLPCVILFWLVVFSPFSIAITSLGDETANLSVFRTLFDLCLFGFVGFLFLLVSGKGCGLYFWHSLDFSFIFLTFFRSILPWNFITERSPLNTHYNDLVIYMYTDCIKHSFLENMNK